MTGPPRYDIAMDTRTGDIIELPAGKSLRDRLKAAGIEEEDRPYVRPMELHPTPVQRATGKVGRNDPCPCGSQLKFKRCCWGRISS